MGYKATDINPKSGPHLKEAIKNKGLTHEAFAEKVNLSSTYVGHMCQGIRAIPPKRVNQFAELLGVRPEYLLGLDDFPTYNLEWLKSDKSAEAKKEQFFEHCLSFWGYSLPGTIAEQAENQLLEEVYRVRKPTGEIVDIPNNQIEQLQDDLVRSVRRLLLEVFNP